MKHPRARLDRPPTCHILREDPDLAVGIPARRLDRAEDTCVARTVTVKPGRWSGQLAGDLRDGVGLLVLEGLLVRRVGVGGRFGAELLGAGDLLHPGGAGHIRPTLGQETAWRVLERSQLAVLDGAVMNRLVRYPEVIERLIARGIERSRRLVVNMAIVHHPRVDARLQMTFWQLADRWGRADDGQVLLPLRLTHAVLADLIAARRPTVSTALSDLARRRVLCRVENGWLLASEPPEALIEHATDRERLAAQR
jgi:CRP/FNR family transcriptional regulator, cyclic AMP receptor protein